MKNKKKITPIEKIIASVEVCTEVTMRDLKWLKANQGLSMLSSINRPIIPSHVTKVAKSIRKYGMLRPIIVVETAIFTGKKELYIIDGQHAYTACLSLGIEIPYIIIPNLNTIEDIIACIAYFNASSKSWTTLDYVYAWTSIREDYRKLNQLYEQFDFDFETILTVAGDAIAGGGGLNKVKRGEFVITDYDKTHEICQRITDVFEILNRSNRVSNRAITRACAVLFRDSSYSEAKHAKMLAYMAKYAEELRFVTSDTETVKEFLAKAI
jgi:hypothetical protein